MKRAPLTPELVERRLSELQQLSRLGASLLEAELPSIERRVLESRSLRIAGRVPGAGPDPRDLLVRVLPASVDRQLGWMPDVWVDPTNGTVIGAGLTVLVGAAIEERAVDTLPRGHEGIVILRFLTARPARVDALPLLDRSDPHPRLWLCSSRDRARTRW